MFELQDLRCSAPFYYIYDSVVNFYYNMTFENIQHMFDVIHGDMSEDESDDESRKDK